MRNINQNGSCYKTPVDKSKLYYQSGFLRELKKQIPGLTLSVSHLHNKVKEIEGILDNIDIFFEDEEDE